MFNTSVKLQQKDGFHMDLDDYLIGLLQMASELVSFLLLIPQNKENTLNFSIFGMIIIKIYFLFYSLYRYFKLCLSNQ